MLNRDYFLDLIIPDIHIMRPYAEINVQEPKKKTKKENILGSLFLMDVKIPLLRLI